jgi:hypothetical protein
LTFIGAQVHNVALSQDKPMIHQDDSLAIVFRLRDARRQYRYWRLLALTLTFLAGLEAGALAYFLLR